MNVKHAIYAVFAITMVFLSYHIYNANAVRIDLTNKFAAIKSSFDVLQKDNNKLEEDMEYFKDPRNLEKEARARFNYRAPNEKMIIVVPQQSE